LPPTDIAVNGKGKQAKCLLPYVLQVLDIQHSLGVFFSPCGMCHRIENDGDTTISETYTSDVVYVACETYTCTYKY